MSCFKVVIKPAGLGKARVKYERADLARDAAGAIRQKLGGSWDIVSVTSVSEAEYIRNTTGG